MITLGNTKLKCAKIGTFDLPLSTCNKRCKGCYARRWTYQAPNVQKHLYANYEMSLRNDFTKRFSEEIVSLGISIIRFHSSGDFYSQEYVEKVADIVKAHKNVTFYAYTKANFNFKRLHLAKNCILIPSIINGKINFGTLEELQPLIKSGSILCPFKKGNGVQCGISCALCMNRSMKKHLEKHGVVFIKH